MTKKICIFLGWLCTSVMLFCLVKAEVPIWLIITFVVTNIIEGCANQTIGYLHDEQISNSN